MLRFLVLLISAFTISFTAVSAQAGEFFGGEGYDLSFDLADEGDIQAETFQRRPPRRPTPPRTPPRRPAPRPRPGWNCIAENRLREEFGGYDYYNRRQAEIEALNTCDYYTAGGSRNCRLKECFYVR